MIDRVAIAAFGLMLGLALVAAGGDALAQDKTKKKAPPTRVTVDRVVKEPVFQTMPVIGRFVARQSGDVAALVRGPVGEILVDVGDRVTQGQLIARLVPNRIRANRDLRSAELQEKQAALRTAEAQLNLSNDELARLDKLRMSAAFSKARRTDKQNEVLKYQSEVAEAQASVGQAEANLELAEIDLHNAEIRAPYKAVVSQRHVVAGNYVDVGDRIVTLINDQELEVEASVPSDRLRGLKVGRTVTLNLDDGSALKAVVRAVIPAESVMTRTRPVRFVPNMDGAAAAAGFAKDQNVTVEIPISDARDVVTVHKDGVVSRAGGNHVFVVSDGTVEKRTVRLGPAFGKRFEVLSGLRPGDLVAIKGNERLRPGQKVVHDDPDGTDPKPAKVTSPSGTAG